MIEAELLKRSVEYRLAGESGDEDVLPAYRHSQNLETSGAG